MEKLAYRVLEQEHVIERSPQRVNGFRHALVDYSDRVGCPRRWLAPNISGRYAIASISFCEVMDVALGGKFQLDVKALAHSAAHVTGQGEDLATGHLSSDNRIVEAIDLIYWKFLCLMCRGRLPRPVGAASSGALRF
jgi:hypothetical protein